MSADALRINKDVSPMGISWRWFRLRLRTLRAARSPIWTGRWVISLQEASNSIRVCILPISSGRLTSLLLFTTNACKKVIQGWHHHHHHIFSLILMRLDRILIEDKQQKQWFLMHHTFLCLQVIALLAYNLYQPVLKNEFEGKIVKWWILHFDEIFKKNETIRVMFWHAFCH